MCVRKRECLADGTHETIWIKVCISVCVLLGQLLYVSFFFFWGSFIMCSVWGHKWTHFLHALIYHHASYSFNNINQGLFKCFSLEVGGGNLTSPFDSGKPLFFCCGCPLDLDRWLIFLPGLGADVNDRTSVVWVCGLVILSDIKVYHSLVTSNKMPPCAPVWVEKSMLLMSALVWIQDRDSYLEPFLSQSVKFGL